MRPLVTFLVLLVRALIFMRDVRFVVLDGLFTLTWIGPRLTLLGRLFAGSGLSRCTRRLGMDAVVVTFAGLYVVFVWRSGGVWCMARV